MREGGSWRRERPSKWRGRKARLPVSSCAGCCRPGTEAAGCTGRTRTNGCVVLGPCDHDQHRLAGRWNGGRAARARGEGLGRSWRGTLMEDILALILIFGGGAAVAIAFSPIGRAIGGPIRGRAAGAGGLRAELAEDREGLGEDLQALGPEGSEPAARLGFRPR